MSLINPDQTARVLADIAEERGRQDDMWGQQDFPDGTGATERLFGPGPAFAEARDTLRQFCDIEHRMGDGTHRAIVLEEVFEAMAEAPNSPELRKELIQAAGTIVQWIESFDRRNP